jgi:TonB family protein
MKKYLPDWLNRYLVVSLLLHLLIIFIVSKYFDMQPHKEIPLSFEIVNPVEPKPKKLPKLKTVAKQEPKPEPIRHFKDESPINPKAKPSINKDGHIKKETKAKEKNMGIKLDKQELLDKIIGPKPLLAAAKPKLAPSSRKKTNLRQFNPGDIFLKHGSEDQDKQVDKAEKPSLEEVLSNLEKYVDFDKYSQEAYYFGDSDLSFEDQDFHYVWYGKIIKRRVSDSWFPPYVARMGLTGCSVVTFKILRNGDVTDIKLSESSGNKTLDQAALNAVISVERFPVLPVDYRRTSLRVKFSFLYNLRAPNRRKSG